MTNESVRWVREASKQDAKKVQNAFVIYNSDSGTCKVRHLFYAGSADEMSGWIIMIRNAMVAAARPSKKRRDEVKSRTYQKNPKSNNAKKQKGTGKEADEQPAVVEIPDDLHRPAALTSVHKARPKGPKGRRLPERYSRIGGSRDELNDSSLLGSQDSIDELSGEGDDDDDTSPATHSASLTNLIDTSTAAGEAGIRHSNLEQDGANTDTDTVDLDEMKDAVPGKKVALKPPQKKIKKISFDIVPSEIPAQEYQTSSSDETLDDAAPPTGNTRTIEAEIHKDGATSAADGVVFITDDADDDDSVGKQATKPNITESADLDRSTDTNKTESADLDRSTDPNKTESADLDRSTNETSDQDVAPQTRSSLLVAIQIEIADDAWQTEGAADDSDANANMADVAKMAEAKEMKEATEVTRQDEVTPNANEDDVDATITRSDPHTVDSSDGSFDNVPLDVAPTAEQPSDGGAVVSVEKPECVGTPTAGNDVLLGALNDKLQELNEGIEVVRTGMTRLNRGMDDLAIDKQKCVDRISELDEWKNVVQGLCGKADELVVEAEKFRDDCNHLLTNS
ncbi:PREDICTED: clumping factor A-like [Priapulus caudatus]|uniref:Clumping factor A-like n=1 Tax=Priapulus caudatus TaxID=37621 RepID=A0ABM1ELA2_PRICU|nr:PREDICTED: clumping factor A-like [Priapulus caudatus]